MLVLAAVYSKTSLRNHLPQGTLTRETLGNLFRRTIKMLRQVSPNSPVLEVDAVILEHINKDILRLEGPHPSEFPRLSAVFPINRPGDIYPVWYDAKSSTLHFGSSYQLFAILFLFSLICIHLGVSKILCAHIGRLALNFFFFSF